MDKKSFKKINEAIELLKSFDLNVQSVEEDLAKNHGNPRNYDRVPSGFREMLRNRNM